MHRALGAVLALLLVALAGCLGDDAPPTDSDADGIPDDEETALGTDPTDPDSDDDGVPDGQEVDDGTDPLAPPATDAYSVVAVIDSGTTPYHEHYQRAGGLPDTTLARFTNSLTGEAPQRIALTQNGTFEERLAADEGVWGNMTQGELYYFEGTNVLGISFSEDEHPVLDDGSHGTATTGAVLDADPGAIVVLVEGTNTDSEAWAAMQDWIDVISMSYGPPGSVPGSGPAVFGLTTHEATQLAWQNGKVPVGAADNTPSLAPNDETAGPPWVLGIGGDHPEDACREHVSGTFPDYTADFTQTLPSAGTVDEYGSTSGTSFSTPASAGTVSAVIRAVRDAWAHQGGIENGSLAVGPDGQTLTNADVREALNRTAYYFDFTVCDPDTATAVNPAAPWLQMGWGHLGPEMVNATVAHLLGQEEAPQKSAEAVAFQEALFAYRQQLWATIG